jgi:hypothetical protein
MENTCEGCATNQPNQLAHMNVGGCLYFNKDDEPEESEVERLARE